MEDFLIDFQNILIIILFCVLIVCGLIFYNERLTQEKIHTKILKVRLEREVNKNGRFKSCR